MLNELEAVNRILTAVGQRPVATLDAPVSPAVSTVRSILDELNEKHQARGWSFNTERERSYTPDSSTGYITLGTDVLQVQGEQVHRSYNFYVERSGDLYDATNKTKVFTSDVVLTIVRLIDFENCPPTFQDYVVSAAQRVAQGRMVGDPSRQRELAADEGRAWTELQRFEAETLNATVFDNSRAAAMVNRRSPLW
jgi:Tail tubular protein